MDMLSENILQLSGSLGDTTLDHRIFLYELAQNLEIEGAFVECGVYRGGTLVLLGMAAKKQNRQIFGFDTFCGLPEFSDNDGVCSLYPGAYKGNRDEVENLLVNKLEIPKENVNIIVGDVRSTIVENLKKIDKIALLHLDLDLYAPTKFALEILYSKIVDGGIIIIHDYGALGGVRKAVDEFLEGHDTKNIRLITMWANDWKRIKDIRRKTLDMVYKAKAGCLASSLSTVEILTILYKRILIEGDKFILSKGHGCLALYAILADLGYFSDENLDKFCLDGALLGGHPELTTAGIEASTGSLGHGLSIAIGMVLANKIDHKPNHVYCLLGDGECNEGSVWEAAMFAGQHKLSNLIAIVDYNKLQSSGRSDEIINMHPFADKWRAFNWNAIEVDGHDINGIITAFHKCLEETEKPSVIIAHTVKGKGVSFIENNPEWHSLIPTEDQYHKALEELCEKQL